MPKRAELRHELEHVLNKRLWNRIAESIFCYSRKLNKLAHLNDGKLNRVSATFQAKIWPPQRSVSTATIMWSWVRFLQGRVSGSTWFFHPFPSTSQCYNTGVYYLRAKLMGLAMAFSLLRPKSYSTFTSLHLQNFICIHKSLWKQVSHKRLYLYLQRNFIIILPKSKSLVKYK